MLGGAPLDELLVEVEEDDELLLELLVEDVELEDELLAEVEEELLVEVEDEELLVEEELLVVPPAPPVGGAPPAPPAPLGSAQQALEQPVVASVPWANQVPLLPSVALGHWQDKMAGGFPPGPSGSERQ